MQTKDSTLINGVLDNTFLTGDNANYYKIARPAYYIEIYEGSIYEWQADPTSAVWNRIDCSTLNLNFQQGQSKTISAQLPIELFRNVGGQLEYNYDTGIYTGTDGSKLSKGYLIRAYSGYCDFAAPYAEHVKLRFTGIIESILPNDDGIIEVNGVDFSVIFMNTLNYNYPDINSYRDLPWTATSARVASNFNATVTSFNLLYADSSIHLGSKLKIGSEVMLVLNISVADELTTVTVQRLSEISSHYQDDIVYTGDEYLVMPEDVYNDNLLNRYVPAYDNWRLDYAIRDLCIKSRFPLGLLSISYKDYDSIRLGRADTYPYMQSKSIFDRIIQTSSGTTGPAYDNESYDTTASTGYPTTVEKKVYSGINEDTLNEAKFKLEFGQSLWDSILTLSEGFGFRVFFDEQGNLTIKSIRQYTWIPPYNSTDENISIVENHVWSWVAWDIKTLASHRYEFLLTTSAIPTATSIRNLRVRFVSNTTDTDSALVQLKRYNSGAWTNIGDPVVIPALKKYQYYEVEIYRAISSESAFISDTYAVEMVPTLPSSAPYFNGLLYLDNNDEVISFTCDNTLNAIVSSAVNSSAEVRNQMTVIGLPDSPQPIISRSIDTTSIYGGKNTLKGGWTGSDSFVSSDHPFMDGRYDKYALFEGTDGLGVRVYSLRPNWNLICLYVKPQTTALGTTITVMNDTGTEIICPEHIINENDLTSNGIWLTIPKTYNKSMVRIYTSDDIYVSEIECYEYDPAYNFVGHKKETIVVKKNISDKATSDWISLTQLEMHRRNIKQFSISSLSNPYIEIGDCGVVAAPEVGAFNDTRLWVTGISTEISRIGSVDALTVVALPPMQSYIKPPDPESSIFSSYSTYDFSISRRQVSSNIEMAAATAYIEQPIIKLTENITAIDTIVHLYSNASFTITPGQLIQIDAEYMLVNTVESSIYGLQAELTVTRARNYTTATTHAFDTIISANQVCSGFQPPDEYLVFSFALTKQQKVQIVVGCLHKKQTIAYVMEEKILDAGVYKRENGIRWDGGINFAKVWPESVNKIYLMPNDSFNYMYNRMFHIGATTAWEDPKYNFYMWQFDQDVVGNYPDSSNSASATSAGWSRTPSQYDASLIIKPVLNGFSGNASVIRTEKRTIGLKTNCHSYKLRWTLPMPLYNSLASFQPVSIPIQISKDGGAYENINDSVYFDAYVSTDTGANVNLMNTSATNPETARRWVCPIALNQIIQWDFTDSQGKTVTVAASPGFKYQMHILNVFDIYGEGVEVIKDSTPNLIDGSLSIFSNKYGGFQNTQPNAVKLWSITSHGQGAFSPQSQQIDQGPWKIRRNNYSNPLYSAVRINAEILTTGGQGGTTDPYVNFRFYKYAEVIMPYWKRSDKISAPASLKHIPGQIIKIDQSQTYYYFRFFYRASTNGTFAPVGVTIDQIWNPYLVIEYRDNTNYRVCKSKYFKMTLAEVFNNWTSSHYILETSSDLNDVDIIQGIGVEFRCLDEDCPDALLKYSHGRNHTGMEYHLGIDSMEFGKGNTIYPDYQNSFGDPRTSDIFYLTS